MWSFLSWIWGQATKAYALFGYLWDRIKDAAQNAYSWAVNKAAEALSAAKSFAIELQYALRASVVTWIDSVRDTLTALIAAARAYTLSLYNTAVAYVNTKIAAIPGAVNTAITAVKAWVINLIDGAEAAIRTWVLAIVGVINAALTQLQGFLPLLGNLQTLLTPARFGRLADLLNRIYFIMAAFVTNPLGFIYSLLRSTFQSFLCFALAYGLGTVESELPPWPQWGAGGVYPPTPPPPPGEYPPSGLVAPLGRLRISGYTFGPGHRGLDLAATDGEAIYAMHAGRITAAGWSNVGYGFYVVVSSSEWWSLYAHALAVNVAVGQDVTAGTVIALADNTGNSTGPHLHLEIKRGGQYIDPVTVLPLGG